MFTPRRPVRSFQDLEVYQRLLAVSVAVAKRIPMQGLSLRAQGETLIKLALDLPVKIATAHSLRFADQAKAIDILEDTMLGCNLLMVYLEQYRDIENNATSERDGSSSNEIGSGAIESEFFEEQIKTLLTVRFKVMHLQMSWKKFGKGNNA